jgi:hypothetical protein
MSISSNAAKDAATVRVNDYVRLAVPADVVHDEVHPGAQLSLLRLAWSPDPARRAAGVHLIGAVRNGLVRRVTPSASVDTALLIDMDDDTYAIDFNRDLTWNVPMLDSALSSLVLAHIAELTNGSVKALEGQVTESVNPWLCAAVCAGCAVAILDGVPGDEIPACLLCANVCSAGSGLAATEPDPVFLKA